MTPFTQLLRQPVRLTAVILLLSMTAAFFSLGAGVLISARVTLDKIEQRYVTIGVPTTETRQVTMEHDGLTFSHEESVITAEMWEYLDGLAENGAIIKGAYQQKFISAYSPSVCTVTSSKEEGAYRWDLDIPYNGAIFAVRVIQVDDTYNGNMYAASDESFFADISAAIDETVMLHSDYVTRKTLNFSVQCSSREEFDALGIAPGKRFLVYGTGYNDRDLELRTSLAESFRCSVEEIDLSYISYDLSPDDLPPEKFRETDQPVAKYENGDRRVIMYWDPAEQVDTCGLTVRHEAGSYSTDFPAIAIDGTDLGTSYDRYIDAYMVPLNTDVETFLQSESGAAWRDAVEELEIQYHAFSVIGTDLLESMYSFHENESFVTQGRSFTESEYQSGANVCLISEATALSSGLDIGDEIDLSFYWGANPLTDISDPLWSLQPQRYSQKVGLSGSPQTYQIVGIYRQSKLWDTASYRFKPNTVFVPNASLTEDCYTSRDGVFFTFVLQNGKIQALRDALSEQGYPTDILFCFDNGYSEIADTLHGFYISAVQLFIAACATCFAALLVYLTLFVRRQRGTVGLMLSLGSGRKSAKAFVGVMTVLPVAASAAIGTVIGTVLMNTTLHRVFLSSAEVIGTDFSSGSASGHASLEGMLVILPHTAILAAIVLIAFFSIAIFVCISGMVRKSPLALLRNS